MTTGADETKAPNNCPQMFAALQKSLLNVQSKQNIPVLAYAIQKGQHNCTQVMGAKLDTPLRWGSITKTVTALTVLALVKDKGIDLDDRLDKYVPDHFWQNKWRKTHPVRIRHLLNLSAGFPDLSRAEFDHNVPVTMAQALALNPAQRTTLWPPGVQHVYSNLTPGLSQLFIESITGLSYDKAVAKLVFTPLRMTQASTLPQITLPGGFKADGVTEIPYWHMTFPADGALNAPIGDLAKLLAQLKENHPSGALAHWGINSLMGLTNNSSNPNKLRHHYGLGIYSRIWQGHMWLSHGGDADGYRSRYAILDTGPSSYIANINTDNPRALRLIERQIERFLTDETRTPTPPPRASLSYQVLNQYVGEYYPAGRRFPGERWAAGELPTVKVRLNNHQLQIQSKGKRNNKLVNLIPVNPTDFRRTQDPVPTITFRDVDGGQMMFTDDGNYVQLGKCPDFAVKTIALCK